MKSPKVQHTATLAAFLSFNSFGGIQHAFTGGDHVVDDDHGLSFHGASQEFVGHNGIPAVDDLGVVTSLIEHTHIHAQVVGQVYGTGSWLPRRG